MPHEVLRTPEVAEALGGMSTREKRSYETARDALRGKGGLHGFPWFASLIHEKGRSISIPPQQR